MINYNVLAPLSRLASNRHFLNRCAHFVKRKMIIERRACHRMYASSQQPAGLKKKEDDIDLSDFPPENIRNFSIIAHVDHGKSTLADRMLEMTGVISANADNQQVLDRLQVEKDRGITVKAQTVSLFYTHKGTKYLLNLIDTPGHVDFHYEVARSLSACQGVILLVDANQGVQAQTVANFFLAFDKDLTMIPVLNKIDLKNARPDDVIKQLENLFEIDPASVLKVSAKHGTGVEEVLQAIVERIPHPSGDITKPFKSLMFDSWFHQYKGVVAHVAVVDGTIQKGDKITIHSNQKHFEVQEVGIMHPEEHPVSKIYPGQVGYLMASIRTISDATVGDTIYHKDEPVEALPGFRPAKPMVFSGVFPMDQSQLQNLKAAMDRLTLNDASVEIHKDNSAVLGAGYRLGFLGLLHMDVFCTRLDQEFNAQVIVTLPNVPYRVKFSSPKLIKEYGAEVVTILNPCKLPNRGVVQHYEEPMVNATIIAPDTYIGDITNLIVERRGSYPDQTYLDNTRILFKSKMPLNEILVDFFDDLKFVSSGYASFDYEDMGYQETDLVKHGYNVQVHVYRLSSLAHYHTIPTFDAPEKEAFRKYCWKEEKMLISYLLNGRPVEELTMLAHSSRARQLAEKTVAKLAENIPRQMFAIAIQASVDGKILCRDNIKAFRKDVTAKCYGGDVTRKRKLLAAQAAGKRRMRMIGNIEVPMDTFIKIVKK